MSNYPLPLSPWANAIPQSATQAWRHLLGNILACGQVSRPRNMEIKELLGSQAVIDMPRPVVLNQARKLSYKFMAAEAWWILSGRSDVESISKYCKAIAQFSDDGETFFGAYGPKIVDQLPFIVRKLNEDPDSRQAVLTIWRENPPATNDVPCTVNVQWFIRDGFLHCIDTMRSNDAWLGFPYDVFNFSMLSWTILEQLSCFEKFRDLRLGSLCLNAGSHHLYERNMGAAELIVHAQSGVFDFGSVAGEPLNGRSPAEWLAWVIGEAEFDSPAIVPSFFSELKSLIR